MARPPGPADSPLARGREAHIQFAGVWHHPLEEDLLVIPLAKRAWEGGRQRHRPEPSRKEPPSAPKTRAVLS